VEVSGEFAPFLARAAAANGGLMGFLLETHPEPGEGHLSDGPEF